MVQTTRVSTHMQYYLTECPPYFWLGKYKSPSIKHRALCCLIIVNKCSLKEMAFLHQSLLLCVTCFNKELLILISWAIIILISIELHCCWKITSVEYTTIPFNLSMACSWNRYMERYNEEWTAHCWVFNCVESHWFLTETTITNLKH